VTVARRAEALGYASVWNFQRLLYPVAPRNEYYGSPGAWPEAFRSTLDPIVALTWAAAHTRTIRLGVSVLVMPFYQPIVLAKQLATLDVMAAGRLEVGLGIG
jgi:alkanesulfonate monooxygenase SsuD/methylene tetrahydromethanopterin reductase-like flavin-dependent oxidoreductase (luciferase family)